MPWGLPVALSALLLSFAVALMGGEALMFAAPGLHPPSSIQFNVVAYFALTLGVVLSASLLVLFRYHVGLEALGFRFPGWQSLLAVTALLPLIYSAIALTFYLFSKFLPGYQLHGNVSALLGTHQTLSLSAEVGIVLWGSIVAPFTEETLFRGILFQGLRHTFEKVVSYRGSVAGAAIISGLVFGLAHGEIHSLPILAFLGVILAFVFQYTRSIYPSVLVHGIFNAVALITYLHGA